MIIGFGFGSPLMALLMLLVTGFLSYSIYKAFRNRRWRSEQDNPYREDFLPDYEADREERKRKRRAYYYEQRERARELMRRYDLTDEEIERRVEEETRN